MTRQEFTYLLSHPESLEEPAIEQLDELINEFPYFQAARALQLNGLNKFKSFKYNQALKKTAAFTTDRNVLFEFITSPLFINETGVHPDIEDFDVIDAETVEGLHKRITDTLAKETTSAIAEDAPTAIEPVVQEAKEVLEIGSPIQFKSAEPHSFNEWMQLIAKKPIERTEEPEVKTQEVSNKMELIDKFLEDNPKISPPDKHAKQTIFLDDSAEENTHLMTETLAKVYLEQKKFDSAIKAYRILSLKYPEKSGFFADRIKAIKILQRNKS